MGKFFKIAKEVWDIDYKGPEKTIKRKEGDSKAKSVADKKFGKKRIIDTPVSEAAITGANAAISFRTKQGGSTIMTGSGITVPYVGDAAGDVRTVSPTGVNIVAEGDFIKVTTDGASTGTCPLNCTFVIRR